MRRATVSFALLAAIWCAACARSASNSIVVVTVTPAPSAPSVTQLRVVLTNAGSSDTKLFPQINSSVPIAFNASFAITFPKSRSGELKIEIDALDASSKPVASGTGRVDIIVGGHADTTIPLADIESADGGILDSGAGDAIVSVTEAGAADTRTFPDAKILDVLVGRDSMGWGGNSGTGGATSTGGLDGGGGSMMGTGGTMLSTGGAGAGGMTSTGTKRDGGTTFVDVGYGGSGGSGTGGSGTGGAATGGTTGGRDAAIPTGDGGSNCFSTIVSNGYTCGNTPACSECKDQNQNSREAGCKKAIDCLAAAGTSCDSSCKQNCLSLAGDSPGMACVTAFQTACSGSGC